MSYIYQPNTRCLYCGVLEGELHKEWCPKITILPEPSAFPPGIQDFPSRVQEESDEDVINKPSHYARWPIEPITFIMRNGFEFWRGNIVKYASRAGYKTYPGKDEVGSEIADLRKVIRYAEMRINQLQGETDL